MKKKIMKMKQGEGLDQDKTDWKRLKAMTDEDIDYSDIPEIDDEFFKQADVVFSPGKKQLTLRLDTDVLEWMKAQGQGYQSRINAVLRAYYEAHKDKSQPAKK